MPWSSLLTTKLRAETDEPVYTPSSVSKLLPSVLRTRSPLAGAVQVHQTALPPRLPAWLGSFSSLVAFVFEPVAVKFVPVRTIRFVKLSLTSAHRVKAAARKNRAIEGES